MQLLIDLLPIFRFVFSSDYLCRRYSIKLCFTRFRFSWITSSRDSFFFSLVFLCEDRMFIILLRHCVSLGQWLLDSAMIVFYCDLIRDCERWCPQVAFAFAILDLPACGFFPCHHVGFMHFVWNIFWSGDH